MSPVFALSARDLRFTLPGGQPLLNDASFELEAGAILAIAGPNGAGKTTLLNLLCGSLPPTGGEIWIHGQNLKQMSPAARARQIAVVAQHEMPDGRLSLRDYVAMGQIPIQVDHSAAEHHAALTQVLNAIGLDRLADKPMATLSGGERQRAHIARAMAQRPTLLFLDEPTNHLDPDAKGRILSLVTELGITVVMIVHDIVLIPEFATHAALMIDGALAGFGPVPDVITPDAVRATFGVEYFEFRHEGRCVPALDVRKTPLTPQQGDF